VGTLDRVWWLASGVGTLDRVWWLASGVGTLDRVWWLASGVMSVGTCHCDLFVPCSSSLCFWVTAVACSSGGFYSAFWWPLVRSELRDSVLLTLVC